MARLPVSSRRAAFRTSVSTQFPPPPRVPGTCCAPRTTLPPGLSAILHFTLPHTVQASHLYLPWGHGKCRASSEGPGFAQGGSIPWAGRYLTPQPSSPTGPTAPTAPSPVSTSLWSPLPSASLGRSPLSPSPATSSQVPLEPLLPHKPRSFPRFAPSLTSRFQPPAADSSLRALAAPQTPAFRPRWDPPQGSVQPQAPLGGLVPALRQLVAARSTPSAAGTGGPAPPGPAHRRPLPPSRPRPLRPRPRPPAPPLR